MRLLLIDGSSLLSTSFFGSLPMDYKRAKTDEDRERALSKVMQMNGEYTNGVFTMMKNIEKILVHQKPSHLSVAWDLNRETFRRVLYPEYKSNRGETNPALKSQFGLAQRVLKEMNISQFVLDGFEADDILGTLSKRFKDDLPVYLLSKDQDVIQLVDEHIRLWLITSKAQDMYAEFGMNQKELDIPDNTFELTPYYVKELYGVNPIQIIDRKALEGDSSDAIPGIRGVGETSSVPLLQEFTNIEGLYEYIEDTPEKEIKAFFKSLGINRSPLSYLTKTSDTQLVGKASALLSKTLATIDCQVPDLVDVQLDDLALRIDMDGRKRVYKELAFKSLLEKELEIEKQLQLVN
ncbi:5'-3' exonuclease H3TH domain-containing protein (plasmid) [Aneurinibacillus sp. Ricciae_BoGa-3]|uniref:5'-3' exonuclease n=1 Tax=Aneurinibacillus sp. Ricciae_BoGa-3 TaxID=3022697 RepID=UPI002341E573|nr:5'-3' exonuclease H3TH domain-containing protein [Aneurinibacillus sp. Ricciae_BoGa-3]WCK57191.1 5'-3' exonuclease H3TH domain-containing protein [Aneurinibacillus sp. Ricciae_BoGa-3]